MKKSKSYWKIPLFDVDISAKEKKAVMQVLKSKWFTMGDITKKFEDEFKKMHEIKYAFAVSSCSSALNLSNLALGIGKGDEVICPSLTFVATVNSVLHAGAKPVFADVTSHNNLNISPEDIERKINEKTKAIIVVHYAGYPCDMKKILKIAKNNNLHVIEDCAHAPLAKYKNKFLGTYGDVGCFSFFSNKNMTTAEGGMVVTNNKKIALKIQRMRSHGMTSLTIDRHKGHAYSYDVVDLGFNYRMDEIRSSLGLAQLKRLHGFNAKRRSLTRYYYEKLTNIKGVHTVFNNFNLDESVCHIFPIMLESFKQRNELQKHLKKLGIQTSIHYPAIHRFSYYKKKFKNVSLPITEDVTDRILTLPLFPQLTKAEINMIVKALKMYFK